MLTPKYQPLLCILLSSFVILINLISCVPYSSDQNKNGADSYSGFTLTPAILTQTAIVGSREKDVVDIEITYTSTPTISPQVTITQNNEAESILPTVTPTFQTVPAVSEVECNELLNTPFVLETDVQEIHIVRSSFILDEAILYMGIDRYIRVFDISNPLKPTLLSVWELPIESEIADIKAHDGLGYVASGNDVYVIDLSSICQLKLLTTIETPFDIYKLELEENRLYVGGWRYMEDGSGLVVTDQGISVFSLEAPTQPRELITTDLVETAIWSVRDQRLYFFMNSNVHSINIRDMPLETQPITIELDHQIIEGSIPELVGDTLYLHSERDGIFVVRRLGNSSTIIERSGQSYPLATYFEVQQDYIVMGYEKFCDEPECSSTAYVLSAENGREMSIISFQPYGEVYRYFQIQERLIYAFSIDSLFIIDLTNLVNPTVTKHTVFVP